MPGLKAQTLLRFIYSTPRHTHAQKDAWTLSCRSIWNVILNCSLKKENHQIIEAPQSIPKVPQKNKFNPPMIWLKMNRINKQDDGSAGTERKAHITRCSRAHQTRSAQRLNIRRAKPSRSIYRQIFYWLRFDRSHSWAAWARSLTGFYYPDCCKWKYSTYYRSRKYILQDRKWLRHLDKRNRTGSEPHFGSWTYLKGSYNTYAETPQCESPRFLTDANYSTKLKFRRTPIVG
jgi:hypothetical protein